MEKEENNLALNSNTRPYRERGESLSFELNSNTRLHRERGENIRLSSVATHDCTGNGVS